MKIQEENNVILPLRAQQSVQHIQLPSVSGTGNMAIGTASPSKCSRLNGDHSLLVALVDMVVD